MTIDGKARIELGSSSAVEGEPVEGAVDKGHWGGRPHENASISVSRSGCPNRWSAPFPVGRENARSARLLLTAT